MWECYSRSPRLPLAHHSFIQRAASLMSSLTMFYRAVLIFSNYFFCMCFVSPRTQTIHSYIPSFPWLRLLQSWSRVGASFPKLIRELMLIMKGPFSESILATNHWNSVIFSTHSSVSRSTRPSPYRLFQTKMLLKMGNVFNHQCKESDWMREVWILSVLDSAGKQSERTESSPIRD